MSQSNLFHYQSNKAEDDLVIVVTRSSHHNGAGKPEQLPRLHKFNQKEWPMMKANLEKNGNVFLEILNMPNDCEAPKLCDAAEFPALYKVAEKLGKPLATVEPTPEPATEAEEPEKKSPGRPKQN